MLYEIIRYDDSILDLQDNIMRYIIYVFIFFIPSNVCLGSNGCNNSLLNIVPSNEFAIVGEVQNIQSSVLFTDSRLTLHVSVKRVLKGMVKSDFVEIEISNYFFSNYSLENGFLSFLFFFNESYEDSTVYYLSSPCCWFILSETNQSLLYKTVDLISIHESKRGRARMNAIVDWSLGCLEETGMVRAQGMLLFFTTGPFFYYHDQKERYCRKFKYVLKPHQRKTLVEYFLTKETLLWGDIKILPLIKRGHKKAIYSKMVESLKSYDDANYPWMLEMNLMHEIVSLNNDERLIEILHQIETVGIYSCSEELKKLTKLFISNM